MRWFKHLSHAHEDKALSELEDELGVNGSHLYGVYWHILETIAALMEKGSMEPTATYSDLRWASICHCSVRKFRTYVHRFEFRNLIRLKIVATSSGDRMQIDCPKLLKYRDEYSKTSVVTPDIYTELVGAAENRVQSTEVKQAALLASKHSQTIPGWLTACGTIREFFPNATKRTIGGIVLLSRSISADIEDGELGLILREIRKHDQRSPRLWHYTLPEHQDRLLQQLRKSNGQPKPPDLQEPASEGKLQEYRAIIADPRASAMEKRIAQNALRCESPPKMPAQQQTNGQRLQVMNGRNA